MSALSGRETFGALPNVWEGCDDFRCGLPPNPQACYHSSVLVPGLTEPYFRDLTGYWKFTVDQRYYLSLLALFGLVVVAWSIGPADPDETANSAVASPENHQVPGTLLAWDSSGEPTVPGTGNDLPLTVPGTFASGSFAGAAVPLLRDLPELPMSATLSDQQLMMQLEQRDSLADAIPGRQNLLPAGGGVGVASSPALKQAKVPAQASGFDRPALQVPGTGGFVQVPGTGGFAGGEGGGGLETPGLQFAMPNIVNKSSVTPPNRSDSETDPALPNRMVLKPIRMRGESNQSTAGSPDRPWPTIAEPSVNFPPNLMAAAVSGPPLEKPMPGISPQAVPGVGTRKDIHSDPLFDQMEQGLRAEWNQRQQGSEVPSLPASNKLPLTISRPKVEGAAPNARHQFTRRDYIWHVVAENQSLESISFQYAGDSRLVRDIFEMNQDLIQDPLLLPVGKAIRIPTE